MQRSILAMIVLIACSPAAFAQVNPEPIPQGPPSQSPPAATATTTDANAAAPANPDDLVTCRYERVTGSLFQSRICHTQRQWKQRTQDAHDTMDKASNAGGGQPRGS